MFIAHEFCLLVEVLVFPFGDDLIFCLVSFLLDIVFTVPGIILLGKVSAEGFS